jgi:hypothetical protein
MIQSTWLKRLISGSSGFFLLFLVFYPEFIYYEVRFFLRKGNLP